MKAKIAVIGLGSIGSMALWQLAKQGVSVIGFEQFGIGHDRSAAGGDTRLFRTAYKEGSEYVPLLQEAKKLWRELEAETGNQILTLNGGLTIGNEESELVQKVLKSINDYKIEHTVLDYAEASKKYPQHKLLPDELMIFDKEAGFVRSELAVITAVTRAMDLGATVYQHTAVDKMEPSGDGIKISAMGKQFEVEQVLITAGPWASQFVPDFQKELEATRLILSWYEAKDTVAYQPDQFPVFIRHRNGLEFYGAPAIDRHTVKICYFNPDFGHEKVDPDHHIRNVGMDEFVSANLITELFEGLYPNPVRLNAYMDAFTPDCHGMVGRVPGLPQAVIASGFSGHGFKLAPAFGKIAAELLLQDESSFSIDYLNPARFTTVK